MTVTLKKSQITSEFIIFSGIALIASIIFISISVSQLKTLYETKELLLVKDVALKIEKEIDITSDIEDGYYREFELPEKIDDKDYNISIVNNTLTVYTNTTAYFVEILNITGYLKKESNTIKKVNGVVHIN